MKKDIFILLIVMTFLFGANPSYSSAKPSASQRPAYTSTVDSLLNLIDNATVPELIKLYPYLHKALYEVNDIDIHLKYNHDFEAVAQSAKNRKAEAIAHVLRVEALYNYRMPDSILLETSLKALDFMRDVPGADVHYFYTASVVGDIYMQKGNYDEALKVAEEFYKQAKEMNNSSGLVASLQTMGKAYEGLGLLNKAEISFRESIAAADERRDHGMKGESYSYLVDMLNEQKRYEDALKANQEFEIYLIRIDAHNSEVKNLCFLNDLGYATSYSKLGQYKLAKEYIAKAEKFPVAQSSLGLFSVEEVRYQLLFAEGKYAEAEQSLNQLEDILKDDVSSFKSLLKIKEARAELYFHWGKYDKAANLYKENSIRKDSLQRVEIATRLHSLRTLYEVDKLELQKEQQKQTFQTTLIGFSVTLILLSAIIAIVLLNARRLRAKNRSLLNRIREQDKLEQENEQMRNQLAQHRLEASVDDNEDTSPEILYLRLKELMKDPTVFTDPDINRKTIAERLGTNEKYVFDTIKKYYGTNISDYINSLRLNYVRNQLALPSDTRTVNAIALDAGFNSRSVFYRLFKEHFGMTPAEFRLLVVDL